jgi:hypothetical protein
LSELKGIYVEIAEEDSWESRFEDVGRKKDEGRKLWRETLEVEDL